MKVSKAQARRGADFSPDRATVPGGASRVLILSQFMAVAAPVLDRDALPARCLAFRTAASAFICNPEDGRAAQTLETETAALSACVRSWLGFILPKCEPALNPHGFHSWMQLLPIVTDAAQETTLIIRSLTSEECRQEAKELVTFFLRYRMDRLEALPKMAEEKLLTR